MGARLAYMHARGVRVCCVCGRRLSHSGTRRAFTWRRGGGWRRPCPCRCRVWEAVASSYKNELDAVQPGLVHQSNSSNNLRIASQSTNSHPQAPVTIAPAQAAGRSRAVVKPNGNVSANVKQGTCPGLTPPNETPSNHTPEHSPPIDRSTGSQRLHIHIGPRLRLLLPSRWSHCCRIKPIKVST